MRRAVILLPLLLGGCSCQRNADDAATDARPSAASEPQPRERAAHDDGATPGSQAGPAVPVLAAVPTSADDENTVVRHYLNALMRGDRTAADAFWSGGRTSTHADDAALRGLSGLRTLRVDTDPAVARDNVHPSRLREVPVRLRAVTADGTMHFKGWYRLQPRPDGSGWEIHGASLQPVLE